MTNATRWKLATVLGGAALVAGLLWTSDAEACGCFAPPDSTVPVVQAGERILFSQQDGDVEAHIQIQYAGNGGDFGWILPLPAVPTLELGSDELFVQLTSTTQPKYRLDREYEGNCSFNPNGGFGRGGGLASAPSAAGGDAAREDGGESYNPLVYMDSVGPYDYAVLKADRKQEMIDWLEDNRYFIPAGTTDVVDAYIHPGAYFLALKLKSGNEAGDLQPVVLKYKSDLPMIPIVLTSVAAQPDMGIQVWMLGEGRAIPRNYYHTVINDAKIDWVTGGLNYNDVIIAATKEAPDRHTFVTEYAGSSSVMAKLLNFDGRFGEASELAVLPDEVAFMNYLNSHGYAYSGQLVSILGRYIPVPPALLKQGITAAQFYPQFEYYVTYDRESTPANYEGWTIDYQPQEMAEEIDTRVIKPALKAGALFDRFRYLTRLYTTLSPEDMTADPVFSFNPGLPDFSNTHAGKLTYHCGFAGSTELAATPATLVTENGWRVYFAGGTGETSLFGGGTPPAAGADYAAPAGPFSARIESLSEEGPPKVETDNTDAIMRELPSAGCSVGGGSRGETGAGGLGLLAALGLLALGRRRRSV